MGEHEAEPSTSSEERDADYAPAPETDPVGGGGGGGGGGFDDDCSIFPPSEHEGLFLQARPCKTLARISKSSSPLTRGDKEEEEEDAVDRASSVATGLLDVARCVMGARFEAIHSKIGPRGGGGGGGGGHGGGGGGGFWSIAVAVGLMEILMYMRRRDRQERDLLLLLIKEKEQMVNHSPGPGPGPDPLRLPVEVDPRTLLSRRPRPQPLPQRGPPPPRLASPRSEYDDAVQDKDLARTLRFFKTLEAPMASPVDSVSYSPGWARPKRDWEVLDTCLNADDMRLMGSLISSSSTLGKRAARRPSAIV